MWVSWLSGQHYYNIYGNVQTQMYNVHRECMQHINLQLRIYMISVCCNTQSMCERDGF